MGNQPLLLLLLQEEEEEEEEEEEGLSAPLLSCTTRRWTYG
jgi:hypothetical protein